MPPRPGDTICGHIQLGESMPDGFGSPIFGEVFVAHDLERNKDAWVTFFDTVFFPSPMELSQFMAGANALMGLRHPSVAAVSIVDREEDYCVVGYDPVPGARPLLELEPQLRTDAREIGRLAAQLARGLAFLHRKNLFHGLLGPRSIVECEGTYTIWQQGVATLCDRATLVQRARRDPNDVYPPQLLRAEPMSTVMDVYAWGATVARLAAPGDALESVHAAMDGMGELTLPDGLEGVVQRALSPNADKRPRDGVHLLAMIEEAGLSRSGAHSVHSAADSAEELSFADLNELGEEPSEVVTVNEGDLVDEDEVTRVVRVSDLPPEPQAWAQPVGATTSDPTSAPDPEDGAAALAALVSAHGGEVTLLDDPPGPAAPVGEAGGEPDLLDLAGSGSIPLGGPSPSPASLAVHTEARAPDAPATFGPPPDDPAGDDMAVDRRTVRHRPPRRPGPHGPPTAPMVAALGLVAALLPGLAFLHVASERDLALGVQLPTPADPVRPDRTADAKSDAKVGEKTGEQSSHHGAVASSGSPPPFWAPAEAPSEPGPAAAAAAAPLVQCPAGMVQVSPKTCMDVAEFPGHRRTPRTQVTFREAAEACEARGVRLCLAKEFQRACAGPRGFSFPYGPTLEAERCNTASVAGFPAEVVLAGAFEGCVTPAGVYDLVGNVGEWVAQGQIMGGDSTTEDKVAVCGAKGRPPPGYRGPQVGFRCCGELGAGR